MRSTGHDYKLETRKLSCYCLNCLEEIDQCQNIDYCEGHRWETQTLKVLKSTTRQQLENMETEQDTCTCSMEEEDMEIDHLENTDSNQQENIDSENTQPEKESLSTNKKNISNQVCLQQSYFQQRKESQSQ